MTSHNNLTILPLVASWYFTLLEPAHIPIVLSSLASVVAIATNTHRWYMEYRRNNKKRIKK